MIRITLVRQLVLLAAGLIASGVAVGQSAWVSDEFEVTLRTGPSTSNAIELMVSSGTALQILEEDAESGYTRVRTGGGTEGWVLTRYLMDEPSAREQLENLTRQLSSATEEGASMGTQLSAIRSEYDSATRQIRELESSNAELQDQIDEISQKAANTLAIDRQNQELQQQLTDAEIQVNVLEQEKDRLSGQSNRKWFITGSLVLLGGVLLGLILPRMKFQKRSRYDRF
jgi:SH3 domain protein